MGEKRGLLGKREFLKLLALAVEAAEAVVGRRPTAVLALVCWRCRFHD